MCVLECVVHSQRACFLTLLSDLCIIFFDMYARKNNLAKFIKVKVTSCEAKYSVPYSEFVLYIPPIQMHTVWDPILSQYCMRYCV